MVSRPIEVHHASVPAPATHRKPSTQPVFLRKHLQNAMSPQSPRSKTLSPHIHVCVKSNCPLFSLYRLHSNVPLQSFSCQTSSSAELNQTTPQITHQCITARKSPVPTKNQYAARKRTSRPAACLRNPNVLKKCTFVAILSRTTDLNASGLTLQARIAMCNAFCAALPKLL